MKRVFVTFCWVMVLLSLAGAVRSFIYARQLTGPSLAFQPSFYNFSGSGLLCAGLFALLTRAYIPNRLGEPIPPQQRLKVIRTLPLFTLLPVILATYGIVLYGYTPTDGVVLAVGLAGLMGMIVISVLSSRQIAREV